MPKAGLTGAAIRSHLNTANPANADASLGDVVYDLINQHNALVADSAALRAKLDTANLAGMGTNNAAAATAKTVTLPENR